METVLSLFGGLIQIGIVGLVIWAVMRSAGRRSENAERADTAASVRRLFVYGLMFITLILAAIGAVLVLQELTTTASVRTDDDRSALAFGLALVIVAGPGFGLLLRHVSHRMADLEDERRSFSWVAYLNLALLVSLIVTTVTGWQMVEGVIGAHDFEVDSVAPVLVWGIVWAVHWFVLRAAYGLPGELYLAGGSLTGLITLAIGSGGLAFVAGDELYTRIVERVPVGHDQPQLRTWAAVTAVGALVWAWHWAMRYAGAERTPLWHTYVVLVGSLGGLAATVASATTIGFSTLVWFVGDPTDTLPSEHFESVPVAAAFLVVGAFAWRYHRYILRQREEDERAEPTRAYDYLSAAAGLTAAIVAATLLLVAVLETVTSDIAGNHTGVANRLILAVTLAAVGGPVWWVAWSRIRRHVLADPVSELGSVVRRIHLIVLFGVGGIVVLVSLINVLYVGIEDLLDNTFGGATVRSVRVGLSLLATVTGASWYHLRVFRADQDFLSTTGPTPPPSPRKHLILVSPRGSVDFAEDLARATGARLDRWYRTGDISVPDTDADEVAALIDDIDATDILVLLGPDGATLVPFET